jgi:SAM-dependent methyltransferase
MEEGEDRAMAGMRAPLQGVRNIIRFNWHFYLLSLLFLSLIIFAGYFIEERFRIYAVILFAIGCITTLISLLVSFYIYDVSGFYELKWMNDLPLKEHKQIVNIHAGFDETSILLKNRFGDAKLMVFDFYDPSKHTEVSIKRARKAYPPFPGTIHVTTEQLPLEKSSTDKIFLIFSAHEIRDEQERIGFLKQLNECLRPGGQIIVTEHLRDSANFLAYNIGFLHFHSRASWLRTFCAGGSVIKKEIKITPFVTTFLLEKHGASS